MLKFDGQGKGAGPRPITLSGLGLATKEAWESGDHPAEYAGNQGQVGLEFGPERPARRGAEHEYQEGQDCGVDPVPGVVLVSR